MKIYIPDLKKKEGDFVSYYEKIDFDSLNLRDFESNSSFLTVSLQAAYVPRRVIAKGEWRSNVEDTCSRCLENCVYYLKESFYEEFVQLSESGEPEENVARADKEEGDIFVFKGETLDLGEYLRQTFIMSQPLKVLCSEGCKGLCSVCGANRNKTQCDCNEETIDPRLEVLQQMKNNL